MSRNKSVAGAFRRFGETCNAAQGTQRLHSGVASGQDLMGIALMSYVKNQPVRFRMKDPMDGHNDLHCTQAGSQVAACPGNSINEPGPQQLAQSSCLAVAQITQVVRNMIQIQNDITPRPVSGRIFHNYE